MGITVTWDNDADRRVIHFDIDDYWTWEDFKQALNAESKLGQGMAGPVDLIINLQPGCRLNIVSSQQLKNIANIYETNIRQAAIISDNLFIRKRMDTFCTDFPAYRERVCVVLTLDAAHKYLARSDQAPET